LEFKKKKKRSKKVLNSPVAYHLYFWLFFYVFNFLTLGSKEGSLNQKAIHALEYLALIILPVYIHFFLLERFFYRKRYLLYAIFLLAVILGYGYFTNFIMQSVLDWKGDFLSGILFIILMLFISTSIKVMADNLKQRFQMQQIKAKQVKTELNMLKAQINPHFLFNTLNNLFGMARRQDKGTAAGIAGLSHLMRYMIYDAKVEKISLKKEVDQIKRLIDLQKLRFSPSDKIAIDFRTEGDVESVRIPPMLLIPFVENAFKHGISIKASSFILILLDVEKNSLRFTVRNSVHPRPATKPDLNSGVGLQNVKRRLEILFPYEHELNITDSEEAFEIILSLKDL
jgi:sensor histidine kinase YesM